MWVPLRAAGILSAATLLAVTVGCGGARKDDADVSTVYIGTILTVDAKNSVAQAVSVSPSGHIVAVGSEKHVREGLPADVKTVKLAPGQVMAPGFVDPHMHLGPTIVQDLMGTHNIAPCLPPPYESRNPQQCARVADVTSALQSMTVKPTGAQNASEFILGMNLDPSRQPFVAGRCGTTGTATFTQRPKVFLDACVSKERPVLVLDQSGHLAYANDKAFAAVCGGQPKCAVPNTVTEAGGGWVTDDKGEFTGVLQEAAGYAPFMAAMGKSNLAVLGQIDPKKFVAENMPVVAKSIDKLRAAGLTTIVDGGVQGRKQLEADELLTQNPDTPLRVTAAVTFDTASRDGITATGPGCDPSADADCVLPKWLGARGIKLWVDGSTQGCTAKLAPPISYRPGGHCDGAGEGRADVTGPDEVVKDLQPYWTQGDWQIQAHANGNEANRWIVAALAKMQLRKKATQPVLIIHHTVVDESLSADVAKLRRGDYEVDGKKVPALDVRVTHLIGHVAYWGAAFDQMLSPGAGANIDPIGWDRKYGIPWSMHSDSMVTPSHPLWFIQQAVTRQTWAYPDFTKSYVLGPQHRAPVQEALRAVTIEPATQHGLQKWVGSLEPGKVADFVVLGANPLTVAPDRIGAIPVVNTYLGGKSTAK
ncbi:MAG TPA: amidohydrolase family protein [Gordonia sp. (in: high G+C Gram-positive bacteria)]|uniref:amidohydrolase n=1 Tax=unclassified Gordonia (in: high G+C Gram-positive bacteria) TaxID=2657482 RepID=UPI000FBA9222|nr:MULTISPECIES: amidohydrolase family protein [unclassified Gordonia (in: high G+C Gram-positive bacteria)]RUP39294.1 MAG: amidohydrolase [Gordonia sp. (in: high G+C Gram-positive bacteria)]HNP55735.1 amidohydrolase family protein [Gordonia sp. (in: high G+C Gram-positive bacteria)]HRC49471.1 amidohydrolase family protein [Gordonia sp. (in: high G+C Gram-positive bacteria)]